MKLLTGIQRGFSPDAVWSVTRGVHDTCMYATFDLQA